MYANETVLVTGGAGFIGSELVRQLLDYGNQVVVFDNFSFGKHENLPTSSRLHIVEDDLNEPNAVNRTIEQFSPRFVFHLAAIHFIPYCIRNPNETIRVNLEGTHKVLAASEHKSVECLIYASTAAVYSVQDAPHRESDPTVPLDIYGATKLFGETLVRLFHETTGKKAVIARLFNGFGPRETNPHVFPEILKQLHEGKRIVLGNLEPRRDFIHTTDISSALLYLSAMPSITIDIFNISTGQGLSISKLVAWIAEILERDIELISAADKQRSVERMNLVGNNLKIRSLGWKPEWSGEKGLRALLKSEGLLA